MIAKIDRVVLGEYTPDGESFRIKVIEVISDPYRIDEFKKSLSVPRLTKSPPSFIGSLYNLIFLDKDGNIVAAAIYRLTRFGYVLKLSPRAALHSRSYFDDGPRSKRLPGNWDPKLDYRTYTIPFNDWQKAIGYAPGW